MALNLAIQKKVDILVDLDIVNPYFRSREAEDILAKSGIKTISSGLERAMHVDLPYLSKEVFIPFQNRNVRAIYDLGGSGSGARPLRQFGDFLPNEDVDLLFCINIFREVTDTPEKIIKEIDAIEESSGMRPTGLINCTNLMKNTTFEDVLTGEKVLLAVSKITGLPVVYTGIVSSLEGIDGPVAGEKIRMKLYLKKNWL